MPLRVQMLMQDLVRRKPYQSPFRVLRG